MHYTSGFYIKAGAFVVLLIMLILTLYGEYIRRKRIKRVQMSGYILVPKDKYEEVLNIKKQLANTGEKLSSISLMMQNIIDKHQPARLVTENNRLTCPRCGDPVQEEFNFCPICGQVFKKENNRVKEYTKNIKKE